jgi:3-deoxy-D-manno-octulosonic-acid transferase
MLSQYNINNADVCGDTRFDRVIEIQKQARLLPEIEAFTKGNKLILIAGSSWLEDEEIIIPYFNEHKEVKLIIAPHEIHTAHLVYIQSLIQRPAVRLSEANINCMKSKDCLIIDSFGLLSSIYRYGNVAYIGGGFGRGIHNTLEAAVYGIPVIFGPNHQKFKEARDLISCGGGYSADSRDSFGKLMDKFLADSQMLIQAGSNAGNFVHRNVGATERIMEVIFS